MTSGIGIGMQFPPRRSTALMKPLKPAAAFIKLAQGDVFAAIFHVGQMAPLLKTTTLPVRGRGSQAGFGSGGVRLDRKWFCAAEIGLVPGPAALSDCSAARSVRLGMKSGQYHAPSLRVQRVAWQTREHPNAGSPRGLSVKPLTIKLRGVIGKLTYPWRSACTPCSLCWHTTICAARGSFGRPCRKDQRASALGSRR